MSSILTRSITALCGADHRNDPVVLASWTRNKSPTGVAQMLANPDLVMFVAERDGEPAAVGAVDAGGAVRLNYVSPDHRFAGLSRTLLAVMEAELLKRGIATATLESTVTALGFYQSAGWLDVGEPDRRHSVVSYPMSKRLDCG